MENKINERVNISDIVTGNIVLPEIDVKKYIGKKTEIESFEEIKGNYGYFVKLNSKIVAVLKEVINKETGEPLELRASKILGISQSKDGKLGWNDKTMLGIFLKKMGVNHYKELIGKTVIIQTRQASSGKEFLSF